MGIIIMIIGLMLYAGITILVLKEGMVKVEPNEAAVVNNIWTGKAKALFQGTRFIIPGLQKIYKRVTLKNEPSDPEPTKAISADQVDLTVDYVIFTQQVIDPVLAATKINYDKRPELIRARIEAFLQDELCKVKTENLFLTEDKKMVVKKDFLSQLEKEVNEKLKSVQVDWGILVVIQIENIILPQKLSEVAEEAATAEKEGQRIAAKAEKAGVSPTLVLLGDVITDAIRALAPKGGKK